MMALPFTTQCHAETVILQGPVRMQPDGYHAACITATLRTLGGLNG